ncbi:hypothetical protein [Flavobacterium sp. DSP2-3-1]|uniref:hypothetical protein n=1 Tax=Flavobacterium sp. DSP2-3-1 TaxID=2804620 RepID=UPI003CF563F6
MEHINIFSFFVNDKKIKIVQEITDFFKCSYLSFDGKSEMIQMEVVLNILCEDVYVNIPYFVLLDKTPDDFGISNNGFLYLKYIYRKTALSEIKSQSNQGLMLYIVSIIESLCNNPTEIKNTEFDGIMLKSIFNVENKNWDKIQYGIFNMEGESSSDFPLKGEMTINYRNSMYTLKLLPIGNVNVYNPYPKIIKDNVENIRLEWKIKKSIKKNLIFSGSFEECLAVFKDRESLEIQFREFKREKSMFDGFNVKTPEDSEREYFDTMTDGNLGDFDDFHGNSDDIETWSRG